MITLRRGFDASLKLLTDPQREVYLAMAEGEIAGFAIINTHGSFPHLPVSLCCLAIAKQGDWNPSDRLCREENL